MIALDTHIWIWWVHGDGKLSPAHKAYIQAHERPIKSSWQPRVSTIAPWLL